jgi:hypothetical protein
MERAPDGTYYGTYGTYGTDGTYNIHNNLMKLGGSLGNEKNLKNLKKLIILKTRYISDCLSILRGTIYTLLNGNGAGGGVSVLIIFILKKNNRVAKLGSSSSDNL